MGLYDREDNQETKSVGPMKHLARVQTAEKWRRDAGFDETWSKLVKLYGNQYDYPELSDDYDDVIAPNMTFSTTNIIVPSVTVNYPKITVTPRRPEWAEQAEVVEAVANYAWRTGDVHSEFRELVKDFVIIGHGWGKVSWETKTELLDWEPDEWRTAAEQALLEREMAVAQGVSEDDLPSVEDVLRGIPAKREVTTVDRPRLDRVSPFDMYVDPDATNLRNARWIAQRQYVPLETARRNKTWNRAARRDLKATSMSKAKEEIDILFRGEKRGQEAEFVVVWEYYDLLNNKVCTFAEGSDKYLLPPERVPFSFGHPFVFVQNYKVPDKLYPIGDMETIAPLQIELALLRTQTIADRKRYRRMYMVRPEAVGDKGMAAMMGSEDNVFIEVEEDRPFNDVLAPVQTTSLPPEFYNQSGMIQDDINLVSGVSEYARGVLPEVNRTATEASMIQDAANVRSADKLAIIERSIGEMAERIVALCQQYMDQPSVAKIVGEDGAVNWVTYSKEELAGEYDFEVEAGSTQPQNETAKRQAALQLMDAMAPFLSVGVVDPMKMAEHTLRAFGVKNATDFLVPMTPVDPSLGQPAGGPSVDGGGM